MNNQKHYYKVKYEEVTRDEENGDYVCMIDFLKVSKVGKRVEESAANIQSIVAYAIAKTLEDDKTKNTLKRPTYLLSDKETVEEVLNEASEVNKHIIEQIKKFIDENVDKGGKNVL